MSAKLSAKSCRGRAASPPRGRRRPSRSGPSSPWRYPSKSRCGCGPCPAVNPCRGSPGHVRVPQAVWRGVGNLGLAGPASHQVGDAPGVQRRTFGGGEQQTRLTPNRSRGSLLGLAGAEVVAEQMSGLWTKRQASLHSSLRWADHEASNASDLLADVEHVVLSVEVDEQEADGLAPAEPTLVHEEEHPEEPVLSQDPKQIVALVSGQPSSWRHCLLGCGEVNATPSSEAAREHHRARRRPRSRARRAVPRRRSLAAPLLSRPANAACHMS